MSTNVNADFSALILCARKSALFINDKPKPMGRTETREKKTIGGGV